MEPERLLNQTRSRHLKVRLALDDRVVVGKRVKCLDEEASASGFDVNVAERSEGHASAGIEPVQQAFPAAVGTEFFLEGPEHIRLDLFQLEVHPVDGPVTALYLIAALAQEPVGHQPPLLRQRMVCRRAHFGERQSLVVPCHEMTGCRNIDPRVEVAWRNLARVVDFEQLGVQRSRVKLKNQLGDFRSNRQHGGDSYLSK